jgi:dephospho-CoA kinase
VQRILLTGMSGVGKSTLAERLSELGYKAVETDYGDFSVVDEHGYQHWDVDRVRELAATEDADVLFVVGSDDAQVLFYPDFDQIVLLRAPRDVMVERLASRSNNPFGKSSEELARGAGRSGGVRAVDAAGCNLRDRHQQAPRPRGRRDPHPDQAAAALKVGDRERCDQAM